MREYLDKEEGHTIGLEGTTQLDKAELGVQLSHALKLAVLLEDLLVDFLLLDVLGGQEISQAVMVTSFNHERKGRKRARGESQSLLEETGLVPVGLVVAELDLALQGSELAGLLKSAGMSSLGNSFLRLK